MTSRERLLKVLSGELPDRVPISTYELCGYNSTSFENREPSYAPLMEWIRKYTDAVTMWEPACDEVEAKSACGKFVQTEESFENGYHVRHTKLLTPRGELTQTVKYQDCIQTMWKVEHLCKTIEDVDALLEIPFQPVAYDFSDYDRVRQETGENGIIMTSLADPVCTAMEMMEFGDATVWALTEPEHFKTVLNELHRRGMINLKAMLEAGTVDLYRICGPEYVTPPYLSPKHFEEYVYPYLCEIVELIHQYGAKARIHSHGRIGRVLDMIIKTGADAIDPCEAPPDGDISLKDVKRRTGNTMTVFGNIQLKLLEHGSEEEVKQAVITCMEEAKAGGRYVLMPTASPINIPLSPKTMKNYQVMISTAREYGVY